MHLPITTIVAAVDLDDDLCEAVLKTAVAMSERLDAKLHAIDACAGPKNIGYPYARYAPTSEIEEYKETRDRRRISLENRLSAMAPRAVVMIPPGDEHTAIRTYIENEGADLLVIGSHQKGFWKRMLGQSMSESLIHDAPCAVLVVPPVFADRMKAVT